jgi:hypothetical protein
LFFATACLVRFAVSDRDGKSHLFGLAVVPAAAIIDSLSRELYHPFMLRNWSRHDRARVVEHEATTETVACALATGEWLNVSMFRQRVIHPAAPAYQYAACFTGSRL